jgi:hypothetical protein
MNAILAVAAREIHERTRLLAISGAFAVVPFLAAAMPVAKEDRAGAIAMIGAVLAIALGLGTAIVLGASMISGELASRRISFYFSRPLSETALWLGKSGAAILVSALAFLIVAVPSFLASATAWPVFADHDRMMVIALVLAAIVVIVIVSHMAASIIRSRSPLIALDFILLLATVGAIAMLMLRILSGGGFDVARTLLFSVVGAALLIIAVAPIHQLRRGRTDPRRSHMALSQAFWVPVGVVVILAAGYVAWLTSGGVASISSLADAASTRGGLALVNGHSKSRGDYMTSFLVDTRSGASTRLDGFWQEAASSRDGKVLAWLDVATVWQGRLKPVLHLKVARADGTLQKTRIAVPQWARLAVSEDGTRIAVQSKELLSVYDIATGQIRAALKSGPVSAFWFVSSDSVRMLASEGSRVGSARIIDFNFLTRQTFTRGTIDLGKERPWRPILRSEDGSRILVRSREHVVDGLAGIPVFSLPKRETSPLGGGAMLRDGRTVVTSKDERHNSHLHVYSRDGDALGKLELGTNRSGWVQAEIEGDRLLIVTWNSELPSIPRDRQVNVINLDTWTVEQTHPGLRGIGPTLLTDPLLPRFSADSVIVTADENHRPLLWDLATGGLAPLK